MPSAYLKVLQHCGALVGIFPVLGSFYDQTDSLNMGMIPDCNSALDQVEYDQNINKRVQHLPGCLGPNRSVLEKAFSLKD